MTKKTTEEINTEELPVEETAAKKATVSAPPDPWERVALFVPRADSSKDDPNVFIGLNGVNYVIPRGVTSMVPRCVAEEYMRSEEAKGVFADKMAALAGQAQANYNAATKQ